MTDSGLTTRTDTVGASRTAPEPKLSPKMAAVMRAAQMDDDGELNVAWGVKWPGHGTLNSLKRRGLINDKHQLTANGRRWFNSNVKRERRSSTAGGR
ncbi:hypothetical protein [Amycolatopsis sp. BJA-103]|uniref:hypothetical protein n=2 Tax=Amycolatopsis sp. BJA-103 TaxID=1911175 RepID=UPI000C761356|nr:hypothetical protein [Amycolatopsis sp. BJA-103]AUI56811.1 hypothetical protein BKN51_00340 [Amycolatopsis sp. BJA-103]PNE13454.1 hypothetical protein B1H26_40210 [Amycolatopsis sp. BJA-103]